MLKRIKTTQGIQKVCTAMRNIAAARLQGCELSALRFRPFAANLEPLWKSDCDNSKKIQKILIIPSIFSELFRNLFLYNFIFIRRKLSMKFHRTKGCVDL